MTVSALSNSASISAGGTIITLDSAVTNLTLSLQPNFILALNGHVALVNRPLSETQIEIVGTWTYDTITNGTLHAIATTQGLSDLILQLNQANLTLQDAVQAALNAQATYKSAATKDTVANGGTVLEQANVKDAAYKEVGTGDGKVLPAEALTTHAKDLITATNAAESREKIGFNDGLSPVELSKLMNPMVDLFKKNKGLNHYAGTATFTCGPGTYRDRHGDLQTSAENELREEEDGFLFYDTYTNYALSSDTAGRDPATLPETNAVQHYSLGAPDTDGWCDFVENTEAAGRYIPPRSNGEIYEVDDPCLVSLEVKPLGTGVDRYFAIGFLIDDTGRYAWAIYDVVNGVVVNSGNHLAVGIKPISDGFICWLSGKMESARHPGSQLRLSNTTTSWAPNYQGDGVSGLKVRRAMMTKAYELVPYIPTTDAAVTKVKDKLIVDGNLNLPPMNKPWSIHIAGKCRVNRAGVENLIRGAYRKNGQSTSSFFFVRLPYITGGWHCRFGSSEVSNTSINTSVGEENFDNFHISIISDVKSIQLYWRGELVGILNDFNSDEVYSEIQLHVAMSESSTEAFNGAISALKIWDYALSEAAIKAL